MAIKSLGDINDYLDPTYGVNGVADLEPGAYPAVGIFAFLRDYGHPFLLDTQGRSLILHRQTSSEDSAFLVLARLRVDGSLDSDFGERGIAEFDRKFELTEDACCSLAVGQGGRILGLYCTVLPGSNPERFDCHVFQCLEDGQLDLGFGTLGEVHLGSYSRPLQVITLQPDGKLLLVGGNGSDGLVIRLLSNGAFDNEWGQAGFGWYPLAEIGAAFVDCIYTQISSGGENLGKIILYGHDQFLPNVAKPRNFIIARLDMDGRLDPGFATAGILRESRAFESVKGISADGVLLDEESRLTVSGTLAASISNATLWMTRYTSDGLPDPSFNSGRFMIDPLPRAGDLALRSRAVQPGDEKVVFAGTYQEREAPFAFKVVLRRYLANGAGRDTDFGEAGELSADLWPGGISQGFRLALQQDGKYLVSAYRGFPAQLSVIRVLPNPATQEQ